MPHPLADCFRWNSKIHTLALESNGISKEALLPLAESIGLSPSHSLQHISIAGNPLDGPVCKALGVALAKSPIGLVSLALPKAQLSSKSLAQLFGDIRKNPLHAQTLALLDVSENRMSDDGTAALCAFLTIPNVVTSLTLANTVTNLEMLFEALVKGNSVIRELDVTGNRFVVSKKEAPLGLVRLLQSSSSLNKIVLTNTQIPIETLKQSYKAIATNLSLAEVQFILSENKLGVLAANLISNISGELLNLHTLDLTDADLGDEGLGYLCEGLSRSQSLRVLRIGKNFKIKSKQRASAIEALISLIDSACPLESLKIDGCAKNQLGADIFPLLTALGSNETITYLDISGHAMGNKGAIIISKALQTNVALRTLL